MTLDPGPLELVDLASATITLRDPFVLGGVPNGTYVVAEVESARFEGERLNASAKGSANADWVTIAADGTAAIDVRLLLETDDGALISVQYSGRLNLADQIAYGTPLFQTGDERYTWLNGIQAVGKGKTDHKNLVYRLYELR